MILNSGQPTQNQKLSTTELFLHEFSLKIRFNRNTLFYTYDTFGVHS